MVRRKKTFVPFATYESRSKTGTEKGYVRLTPSQMYSDAVLDLSNGAYRVFVSMKLRAKGHREYVYTYDMATADTSISRQTYLTTTKELIEVGLIEKIPTSAYEPSRYRFISRWKEYRSPRRDPMTDKRRPKNWKNPRPQPQSKSKKQSND